MHACSVVAGQDENQHAKYQEVGDDNEYNLLYISICEKKLKRFRRRSGAAEAKV